MISEIFSVLNKLDVDKNDLSNKFNFQANKTRIRSISSFSSNTIFYFPNIVIDQISPEENIMITRMLEKTYATFVIACISLIPFHKIKSDDASSIEEYLSQFHQNIGINRTSTTANKEINDLAFKLTENTVESNDMQDLQNFMLECWNTSKETDTNFIKIVNETISVNEMFNKESLDPKTKLLQERFNNINDELNTWGFIGEASDDMFDDDLSDTDYIDYTDDASGNTENNTYTSIEDTLESLSDDDLSNVDPYMVASDAEIEAEFPNLDIIMQEAALSSKDRKKLPVSAFGIPNKRAFPLNDALHIEQAVRMFGRASKEDQPNLAKRIFVAIKKFNVDIKIGEDNPLYQYAPESLKKQSNVNEAGIGDFWRLVIAGMKNMSRKSPLQTGDFEPLKNNLTKTANNLTSVSGIHDMRREVNTGLVQLDKYGKNLDAAIKEGESNKNYKFFKTAIDNGVTKKDIDKYSNWLKTVYRPLLSKRLKELSMNESTVVKTALDKIGFMLDAVSENKIINASSLTRLSSYESKLKILKNKYTKYLNRYKKKYEANKKSGSKAKLSIRFNKMIIDDPKTFMQQYGSFIKIINRRLKLVEKRRTELRKRKGIPTKMSESSIINDLSMQDLKVVDECINFIDESLNSSDKNIFILTESKKDDDFNDAIALGGEIIKNANATIDRIKETRKATEKSEKNDDLKMRSFDKEIFTDMNMKKANDAIPTFAKATISFIVDGTNKVISRDVLIGIKAYDHKVPAMDLVNDLYNAIINKRKFLKFVKFITGEERTISDIMFGLKELKLDAVNSRNSTFGRWISAFKHRKNWAKISIPYLMKEYTPNGTIVVTMNAVEFIKDHYGIDIMTPEHVKMLMDTNFLLGFVVVDQANEIVYVSYDGHNGDFEEYTYSMLEREQQTSDRMMRELYRSFSR